MVTPYAGVWIEMRNSFLTYQQGMSLPTRECGLKCLKKGITAPYIRHSLRGSVD